MISDFSLCLCQEKVVLFCKDKTKGFKFALFDEIIVALKGDEILKIFWDF